MYCEAHWNTSENEDWYANIPHKWAMSLVIKDFDRLRKEAFAIASNTSTLGVGTKVATTYTEPNVIIRSHWGDLQPKSRRGEMR